MTLSGASYDAALTDVEPVEVKVKGYGRQVVIEVADDAAFEALIDRLAVAACDLADAGRRDTVEAIYDDIERADLARAAA